ncbi:mitochondrial 54S ribosomal protein bL36m SKDI_16G0940 [Saccharomyces kudriavzevii IFO 1802]|uniref:Ribosomal protein n=2 Tax=Saccharomyces kudriavzevii (strain ATCC MYA-4449 / AS 2.2408 / CBS 8840 / NBRC 1802 / NCYC 2889) TaxID=226230 RepID=J5RMB5_SACK1|nr:uncharacterized protein SKDI_16G0940 [Saccharomyces kudriavzevii IFO 1802]EJT42091.1 RTC6-like protein [Saccharomyces kudriavzevii IFO 1802]CAI4052953.1 hypothetical protein SKDI_16G0940 [Saccharomyces kudriavzevii IFO 1802]
MFLQTFRLNVPKVLSHVKLSPVSIMRTCAPSTILAVGAQKPTLASANRSLVFSRGFKVRTSIKKFCSDCYLVRRKGRVYIYCKSNKKHKQRQG